MKTNLEIKNVWRMQFKQLLVVPAGVLLLCLAAASSPAQSYTVLHNFGTNGMGPFAGLALSGETLYGTTRFYTQGPASGTVFRINTDGSDFEVLWHFNGTNGRWPRGRLAVSGTTLYGTTGSGGTNQLGSVFKINIDGSGFAVLKEFSGSDGRAPACGMVLVGTNLYGTTASGGSSDFGTVFKIGTDGNGFAVLKDFSGNDGAGPQGGLVLSDTVLYGTTAYGGPAYDGSEYSGYGTVFRLTTDGSDFAVLKYFDGGIEGEMPFADLMLSDATLYGTTALGGGFNMGTVFQINTNGSDFTVLKEFSGADGQGPQAGLVSSGTTLYGTTVGGGISGFGGVVFALGYPPTMQTPPQTQTADLGSTVDLGVRVTGSQPLFHQWFCNGNAMTGCTNCGLCLSGVQTTNVGAYSAVVSNIFGAVTSAPAMLNVIPAVERRPVPGIRLTGESGSLLNVDYANSLDSAPNWTTIGSVSLTGTSQFCFDLTMPLPLQRFYRAWQMGTPSVVPSLNLNFVPAITLTGNAGDSLRVDCINAIGPTDAWMTLDAVTLTNTSQLYFDVSAPGQPPRLYRIVPSP